MPRHKSRYDIYPLPDPGDGKRDPADPPEIGASRHLQVNWMSPQPLHTVDPADRDRAGSGDGQGGGEGGGDGTGGGDGAPGSAADDAAGSAEPPRWDAVKVRPEDVLSLEQLVLDEAKGLAERFNALVTESESVLTADFWGTEEGHNVVQNFVPGQSQNPLQREVMGATHGAHYVYSTSAQSTRKFLEGLRMNQRAALQRGADAITMSGGFIEALNASADAYAAADQYSVFPDKSQISPEQGD
jgi:hypothetical protein